MLTGCQNLIEIFSRKVLKITDDKDISNLQELSVKKIKNKNLQIGGGELTKFI